MACNFVSATKNVKSMLPNIVYTEAATALQDVQSGHRVYVHGSAQTPLHLLSELAKQKDRLRDVELDFITVQGDITVDRPEFEGHFNIVCFCHLELS